MNRYVALGCLGLGLMVSPLLGAIGNTAVPANPKIGVVDMETTLTNTPAGKRAAETYEKTRKAKQSLLDKQQEELKKDNAELDKKKASGVLKPENYEAQRQELEKKFVDVQQTYVKLERELAQDRAKMLNDLVEAARPKIAALAKAEGISVVIDKGVTLYNDPAIDLTQQLDAEMK